MPWYRASEIISDVPRQSNPSLCLCLPLLHPVYLCLPSHPALSEQLEMLLWSFPGADGQRWRRWPKLLVSFHQRGGCGKGTPQELSMMHRHPAAGLLLLKITFSSPCFTNRQTQAVVAGALCPAEALLPSEAPHRWELTCGASALEAGPCPGQFKQFLIIPPFLRR